MSVKRPFYVAVVTIAVMLMASVSGFSESELREWASTSGQMITAKFVRQTGHLVILEGSGGEQYQILFQHLSETDQEYLREKTTQEVAMPTLVRRTGSAVERLLLDDEQIESLITRYPDPPVAGESLIMFQGRVNRLEPSSAQERRKVMPFQISMRLYEVGRSGGRRRFTNLDGTAKGYILNEQGEVVAHFSRALSRLAVDWRGVGGYTGELDKPGEYTFVLYVEHRGRLFGRVQKVTF